MHIFKKIKILQGLVLGGIVVGLLVSLAGKEIRTMQKSLYVAMQDLSKQEVALLQEKGELLSNILLLEKQIVSYEQGQQGASGELAALRSDLQKIGIYSGQASMQGQGIEVILTDAPREAIVAGEDLRFYIVHDVDVLRVINLLRAAGAECISINQERLVSNSRIRCAGPTIRVKDQPLAPPFVIHAIGDPQALYDILTQPPEVGGMSEVDILGFYGIEVEVSRLLHVTIPKYQPSLSFVYAQ